MKSDYTCRVWCYYASSFLKYIYSEKATKFCEISTVNLTGTTYIGQIYGGDFAKFCDLSLVLLPCQLMKCQLFVIKSQ